MPAVKKAKSDKTQPSPEKPPETKEQKLIRLANARVTKACKYISLIGNLSAYKPTSKDIEAIMTALGESCARVENRLNGTKSESVTFTLSR